MPLNVGRIKKLVEKAIQKAPTNITLMRKTEVSDGLRGFVPGEPETVANFDCIINENNPTQYVPVATDGGKVQRIAQINMLFINDDFTPLEDDYFIANERVYRITFPKPIYGIFWDCELEVAKWQT